jgi:hypothetical protein
LWFVRLQTYPQNGEKGEKYMVYIEEMRRSNPPPTDSIEDGASDVPVEMPFGHPDSNEGTNAEPGQEG